MQRVDLKLRWLLIFLGASLMSAGQNDDVLRAESDWFEAMRTGHADHMAGLLDDSFVGTTDVGKRYNKTGWVRQFRLNRGQAPRRFSVGEQEIQSHTDVAVVSGRVEQRRPLALYSVMYTHVWRRKSGNWRLIALQETPRVLPARK